jgi:hypothetical protein
MNRVEISFILCAIGFFGNVLVSIFSNLFHNRRKINSFLIFETTEHVILKNNPLTNILSSVQYFLGLSTFTFLIATNEFNFYIELSGIYLMCLFLTILSLIKKSKYEVIVEKRTNVIKVCSNNYVLADYTFEISSNRRIFWFLEAEGMESYGLYLRGKNNKSILVYGDSIYKDIERLNVQLLGKITAANAGLAKVAGNCSADSFVVK